MPSATRNTSGNMTPLRPSLFGVRQRILSIRSSNLICNCLIAGVCLDRSATRGTQMFGVITLCKSRWGRRLQPD